MISFEEFLVVYGESIKEIYEDVGMSKNAKKAVVSTMRKYLGERKFDPIGMLSLFESVCYGAMEMGHVDKDNIRFRVHSEGRYYLSGVNDFLEPDIDLVERQERARGR